MEIELENPSYRSQLLNDDMRIAQLVEQLKEYSEDAIRRTFSLANC
jgi:hypothetical protein